MDPGVSALGLQQPNRTTYADFTCLAYELRRRVVKPPLPRPKQGSNGDCWLLTAAVGLQCFYPRLILDAVTLGACSAVVTFPRHGNVDVNYVLPVRSPECSVVVHLKSPLDLYWALVEKAVCVLLHRNYDAKRHERRMQRGLGETRHLPHYIDLHGGLVSTALGFLAPTQPSPPCPAAAFSTVSLRHFGGSGLFFLEVQRSGDWHSMLVLASTESAYIAWDPWGQTVAVLRTRSCRIWYFALETLVASTLVCSNGTPVTGVEPCKPMVKKYVMSI